MKTIKGLLSSTLFLPFFVTLCYAESQVTAPAPTIVSGLPPSAPHAETPVLPPRLAAVDANQDIKVSKDELVAFVVKKAEEKIIEKAGRLDTNGDKCLSKEELKGKNKTKVRFDDVDANKDGMLSKDEAVAFVQKKAEERATKLFQKMDKNGDGFITGDELKHPKKEEDKVEETLQEEDM